MYSTTSPDMLTPPLLLHNPTTVPKNPVALYTPWKQHRLHSNPVSLLDLIDTHRNRLDNPNVTVNVIRSNRLLAFIRQPQLSGVPSANSVH